MCRVTRIKYRSCGHQTESTDTPLHGLEQLPCNCTKSYIICAGINDFCLKCKGNYWKCHKVNTLYSLDHINTYETTYIYLSALNVTMFT
jgi:hypothetical protein